MKIFQGFVVSTILMGFSIRGSRFRAKMALKNGKKLHFLEGKNSHCLTIFDEKMAFLMKNGVIFAIPLKLPLYESF
jgi:hypothetical protein